jgi:uncharacterized phage protein
MKLYNYNQCRVEQAKKATCPRCRGFGGIHEEDGPCNLCNGVGKVWKSVHDNGWYRAINQRLEKSKMW